MNRQQAWRSMATIIGHMSIRGYSFMSVVEKATGKWAGALGLGFLRAGLSLKWVGTLHPDFCGKGYATEAGRACIEYVFDVLGWDDVIHVIAPENVASIKKVAEKLGSGYLRTIPNIPGMYDKPCLVYGQPKP